MKVLVFNCGSSSLKFQMIEPQVAGGLMGRGRGLARGVIERIGGEATGTFEASGLAAHHEVVHIPQHEDAVRKVLHWLDSTPGGRGERRYSIRLTLWGIVSFMAVTGSPPPSCSMTQPSRPLRC